MLPPNRHWIIMFANYLVPDHFLVYLQDIYVIIDMSKIAPFNP